MVKCGSPVSPANMLALADREAYAGMFKTDWEKIILNLEILNPVNLHDLESDSQECDICRQSFLPAEDGTAFEKPVSLPCGHVFGRDCLLGWNDIGFERDFREHDDNVDGEQPEEIFRTNSALPPKAPIHIADLMGHQLEWLDMRDLTCPNCRKLFTVRNIAGGQTERIETQLRFWDAAYEKLGVVRSTEEEMTRQDLWRFVEVSKVGRDMVLGHQAFLLDFQARVSVMRFAMRRAGWDLTPVQRYLCYALFNLGCCGLNDPSKEYCAESYEDRHLPLWCLQFEKIELVRSSDCAVQGPGDHWKQQRLGPWRRKMFAEIDLAQSEY